MSMNGRGPDLTPEEIKVLRDCSRESFWFRSLPAASCFSVITYRLIQSGHISASSKIMRSLKITMAGALGYFLGKLSYMNICRERILALPDSRLAEVLRNQSTGRGSWSRDMSSGQYGRAGAAPWMAGSGDDDSQSRHQPLQPNSSGSVGGLDDYYRPSLDSPPMVPPQPHTDKPQSPISYSQLREKNRADYEAQQRRTQQYPGSSPQLHQPASARPSLLPSAGPDQQFQQQRSTIKPPSYDGFNSPQMPPKSNKYGDTWEA